MDAIKVKLIGLSRGGGGNLQPDKTVTPTEQDQTVRPDPGYDGFRQVTVEAIPDQYADVSGVDAGAGDVRIGKTIVGSDGETITGTMPPQKPEEIGHATPTEQTQTVTPTAGSVFSAVEVAAIPSEYADVSGVDATAADVRTGKVIVDAQGDTVTGVMEPQKPEQSKSVVPTVISQLVTPDPGYALSRVDVGAIPSEYADVSDVTATAGTVLTGSDFVNASGTLVHGACDYDADTSDADATAGQIEAGATAYVGGAKVTGTMPIRTTDVEIDSLSPVPIPAGSYDGTASAKLSSAAAAAVVASNIRQGAEILGVQGSYAGSDTLGQYFDQTIENVESDTTIPYVNNFFRNFTSIKSASFPNLATIPSGSFFNCTNLTSVSFTLATKSADSCFAGCRSLESVSFPNLEELGGWDFQNCTNLVSVDLPKLKKSAIACFRGCASLTFVDFPALERIASYMFADIRVLSTIILRYDSVCVLESTSALGGVWDSSGTGGTLYVPQAQIANYQSATNWSVILAYANNQILPIEGSPYEVTT